MTRSRPASNLTNQLSALGSRLSAVALLFASACSPRTPPPPFAEFVIAAGDSAFWIRADAAGVRMRGAPIVLSRLNGRFYELYVEDDDRSFVDAFFVGQTLYQRDLVSGDSIEIFRDSVVAALSAKYAKANPEAQRLAPDEDVDEDPSKSASAELSVLGIHGPYLSVEYHVDTTGSADDTWHMTRHDVVDMRSGRRVDLTELLGKGLATTIVRRARNLYRETVDSVLKDQREIAKVAARAINRFRFDPTSFALAAPGGALMIAFSAPGQGNGGEGFVLPLRPIAVSEPAWWAEARESLPTATTDGEERWARERYSVRAVYDTIARPVRLVLEDSTGRQYPIGGVTAPVHRIYWLDNPLFDATQRRALIKAFDEAALYDNVARTASVAGVSVTPASFVPPLRVTSHGSRVTVR